MTWLRILSLSTVACAFAVALLGIDREAHAQVPQDDDWYRIPATTLLPAEPPPAKASSVPARVEPPEYEPPYARFGSAGVFVLTSDVGAGLAYTTFEEGGESFSASFSPGIDYFLFPHVSVGVGATFGYAWVKGVTASLRDVEVESRSFGGNTRVGVDIPLGCHLSIYGRAYVGYSRFGSVTHAGPPQTDREAPSPYASKREGAWVGGFVPVVFHPAPHVIIGVGPAITHELGRDDSGGETVGTGTSLAARLVVGGYWGGVAAPRDESVSPPSPRFGREGHTIVTGELESAAISTRYSATGSTAESLALHAGADRFVMDNLTLGFAATFFSSNSDIATLSGRKESFERLRIGIGPRLGLNLPVSAMHSFYPRLLLSAGYEAVDGSAGAKNDLESAAGFINASLFAPWLVHVVPHAFVGFGPYVSQDIIRQQSTALRQSRGTSVGATFIIGAWL